MFKYTNIYLKNRASLQYPESVVLLQKKKKDKQALIVRKLWD